jgi:hypothetical protein
MDASILRAMEIPRFRLFGEGDPEVEHAIQPKLELREWDELDDNEKNTALLYFRNNGWLGRFSREVLGTIEYLNKQFLRECPGKELHQIQPTRGYERLSTNETDRMDAALEDFAQIFLQRPGVMVHRMLSVFASCHIEHNTLKNAEKSQDTKRKELVDSAFEKFDRLANCLNHMFEQFAVNQLVTRAGFVPRQDDLVTAEVYVPTLAALSDPRWKPVSNDLASAFGDYRNKAYPEAITKHTQPCNGSCRFLRATEARTARARSANCFNRRRSLARFPSTDLPNRSSI